MFLNDKDVLEPKFTITINKKAYIIKGTFKILKVIQESLNMEITELSGKLLTMPFTDMAKLIRVAIYPDTVSSKVNEEGDEADKKRLSLDDIEEWMVEDSGIDETRCLLFDFMRTAIVPKKKRKEAHERAIALLGGLLKVQAAMATQTMDSLGESIENSASES